MWTYTRQYLGQRETPIPTCLLNLTLQNEFGHFHRWAKILLQNRGVMVLETKRGAMTLRAKEG